MKFLDEAIREGRNAIWTAILNDYIASNISHDALVLEHPLTCKPDLVYFISTAKDLGMKEFTIPTTMAGIERVNGLVSWMNHLGYKVKNLSSEEYPFVLQGKLSS